MDVFVVTSRIVLGAKASQTSLTFDAAYHALIKMV